MALFWICPDVDYCDYQTDRIRAYFYSLCFFLLLSKIPVIIIFFSEICLFEDLLIMKLIVLSKRRSFQTLTYDFELQTAWLSLFCWPLICIWSVIAMLKMLTDTRVTEEQIQLNTNSYLEGSNDLPLSSYNTKISKFAGTQKQNLHWKLGQQTPFFGSLFTRHI